MLDLIGAPALDLALSVTGRGQARVTGVSDRYARVIGSEARGTLGFRCPSINEVTTMQR